MEILAVGAEFVCDSVLRSVSVPPQGTHRSAGLLSSSIVDRYHGAQRLGGTISHLAKEVPTRPEERAATFPLSRALTPLQSTRDFPYVPDTHLQSSPVPAADHDASSLQNHSPSASSSSDATASGSSPSPVGGARGETDAATASPVRVRLSPRSSSLPIESEIEQLRLLGTLAGGSQAVLPSPQASDDLVLAEGSGISPQELIARALSSDGLALPHLPPLESAEQFQNWLDRLLAAMAERPSPSASASSPTSEAASGGPSSSSTATSPTVGLLPSLWRGGLPPVLHPNPLAPASPRASPGSQVSWADYSHVHSGTGDAQVRSPTVSEELLPPGCKSSSPLGLLFPSGNSAAVGSPEANAVASVCDSEGAGDPLLLLKPDVAAVKAAQLLDAALYIFQLALVGLFNREARHEADFESLVAKWVQAQISLVRLFLNLF